MEFTHLLKYCSFLMYNLVIYFFVNYLTISNTWDTYKDWLFNDIQDDKVYEYIIGE